MEKLMELLNEYEIEREEKIDLFNDKEKPLWERYIDCTNDFTFEPTDNNDMNGEFCSGDTGHSVIISKSYGFIEWLVENDKIDTDKLKKESYNIKLSLSSNFRKNKNGGLENYFECKLLMILSISDTPIDDLISYLK